MKKLLIIIPFILFSCIDSELIIPDETTGNINNIDIEDADLVLKEYKATYSLANYTISFENNALSNDGENAIVKRNNNNRIVTVKRGNDDYTFLYDNDNKTIKSIQSNDSSMILAYNDDGKIISATKGNTDYEFITNDLKYLTGFTIKNETNTKAIVNFSGSNVGSITYSNNTNDDQRSYSYDKNKNPIKNLGYTDYNALFLLEAFINDSTNIISNLDKISLLINENNRTKITVNSNEVYDLKYSYTKDNNDNPFPEKSTVNLDENSVGNTIYTY